jgi:hypothetical protein
MKKIIIVLALVGCSEKRAELIKEIESDTLITQDTMIGAFANQIKDISKTIETKNVSHKKSKDSMNQQLKKLNSKTKDLESDNEFYRGAINDYSEIVNIPTVKDAYFNSVIKDTTK